MHTPPLAQRLRPQSLSQVVGQKHLLGEGAPLAILAKQGFLPSLILYGPAGVGKTTLALLLAKAVDRPFYALSAVESGLKDLREAIERKGDLFGGAPVVFVDEIHRFNKAQQDALLKAVETGDVTLIGATTENPSFSVNNALLSRCQVYALKSLEDAEIAALVARALKEDAALKQKRVVVDDLTALIAFSQGDGRRALGLLELICAQGDDIVVNQKTTEAVAGKAFAAYDKDGDNHYDIVSALIKSIRGSDADAALYWLARALVAGEDPAFLGRRLVICASEDVGLANPNALLLADTALRSVQSIGMPEARIILGQAAVYLANSPKSNSSYKAINRAIEFAKAHPLPVPVHLKNATGALAKQQGYGADYRYPHDFPNHYCAQQYLPDKAKTARFYEFADNPKEQASFAFVSWLKQNDKAKKA